MDGGVVSLDPERRDKAELQGLAFSGWKARRIRAWLRAIERDPSVAKLLFRTRAEREADER